MPRERIEATAVSSRLRTAAAAAYCGLAPGTFENLRVSGGGPVYLKLGRRVVYDVRDLDLWLGERRRDSTSVPSLASDGSPLPPASGSANARLSHSS